MAEGINLTQIFPTITALVSSIDKLREAAEKARELEEKKTAVGALKPEEQARMAQLENEKKMQIFSMGALLINQVIHLLNLLQSSTQWQARQTEPAERTMQIVESAARAGQPLSIGEIRELFQREAGRGRQIGEAMTEGESVTGLTPSWATRGWSSYVKNFLEGARGIKGMLEGQQGLWDGNTRGQ